MEDELAALIDDLDACFVACEEGFGRARDSGLAARDSPLASALLLAAATAALCSELSAEQPDGSRLPAVLAMTAEACARCAEECERYGADWVSTPREACVAVASSCRALAPRFVADGPGA